MKRIGMVISTMAIIWVALAACTPQAAPAPEVEQSQPDPAVPQDAVQDEPTAVPEPATPTTAPTDTPEPAPTVPPEEVAGEQESPEEAEPVEETEDDPDDALEAENEPVQFGRTEEGAFFYGSPTAEITLIDHSDFL